MPDRIIPLAQYLVTRSGSEQLLKGRAVNRLICSLPLFPQSFQHLQVWNILIWSVYPEV